MMTMTQIDYNPVARLINLLLLHSYGKLIFLLMVTFCKQLQILCILLVLIQPATHHFSG